MPRPKQTAGMYSWWSNEEQNYMQRPNRKLRRSNLARARKTDPKYRAERRENRALRSWKAGRIYESTT